MNTRLPTQTKISPKACFIPVQSELLQRKCACGNSAGLTGECSECQNKQLTLQRRATDRAESSEVPPIVHEVLTSPGQPLDPDTRTFMESYFGHDFSQVRVHIDAKAAESARAVNALAYTVGRDVVFGAGQYAPVTLDGRKLLAHELAHVRQQGTVSPTAVQGISSTLDATEKEADLIAAAIAQGYPLRNESESKPGVPPVLARYAGVPPPPAITLPPSVSPTVTTIPGVSNIPSAAQPGPIYAQQPLNSLANLQLLLDKDAVIREGERPRATLERGGKPPDFISVMGQEEAASAEFGTITYRVRGFHLLDAMEYDIANAKSSSQVVDIYNSYFPDSFLRFAQRASASNQSISASFTSLNNISFTEGLSYNPKQLDPGGVARTPVFLAATWKKSQQNPSLSTDDLMQAIIEELVLHEAAVEAEARAKSSEVQGPCQATDVPRKGGNKDHDDYANRVTGVTQDYKINTPDGRQCITDGRDSTQPGLVWEVKTKHQWATSYGSVNSIFSPNVQNAIYRLEEQHARCLDVTQRCGFRYAYAFETKEAADFMKKLWDNKPPVYHMP